MNRTCRTGSLLLILALPGAGATSQAQVGTGAAVEINGGDAVRVRAGHSTEFTVRVMRTTAAQGIV